MKDCYVVTCQRKNDDPYHIEHRFNIHVFTKREDAQVFIQACENHETDKGKYVFDIDKIGLDGDPMGHPFFH